MPAAMPNAAATPSDGSGALLVNDLRAPLEDGTAGLDRHVFWLYFGVYGFRVLGFGWFRVFFGSGV